MSQEKKKLRLTAEEDKQLRDAMKSAYNKSSEEQINLMAMTLSYAYDEELPLANPLSAIADFKRAGNRPEDNRVFYIAPFGIDKLVYTLDNTCTVTEKVVTPGTRTELSLAEITSPDFAICLNDFLSGDYDGLAAHTDEANEMIDRYEIKYVLDLLDAGAIAAGNTFTLDSDKEAIDYPKLIEMVRKVAKYGTNLVLIAGANIWTDLLLMDYIANTFRKYGAAEAGVTVIPLESQELEVNDSGAEVVMDPDVAYLVATSDRKQNKPVLVARRKLDIVTDKPDTKAVSQDRIVIDDGNKRERGTTGKLQRSFLLYEHFGAVLLQPKNVVKFTKI